MTISVFERMSSLAAKHAAVNLGQGFLDFGWPEEALDAAARALREGSNQYPPSARPAGAARGDRRPTTSGTRGWKSPPSKYA